jgi:FO synthase
MAGSEHGSARSVSELAAVAEQIGRPWRIRATDYGPVPDERVARALAADGALAAPRPRSTRTPRHGSDLHERAGTGLLPIV